MHLPFIPFLLFVLFGTLVVPGKAESAMEIARVQVAFLLSAVSSNNTEVILELFETDQENAANFINMFQGISIEVTSANFENVGVITMKAVIAEILPVVMVINKNDKSLTFWKFTKLEDHKPGSNSQKMFSEFTMSGLGSSVVP